MPHTTPSTHESDAGIKRERRSRIEVARTIIRMKGDKRHAAKRRYFTMFPGRLGTEAWNEAIRIENY